MDTSESSTLSQHMKKNFQRLLAVPYRKEQGSDWKILNKSVVFRTLSTASMKYSESHGIERFLSVHFDVESCVSRRINPITDPIGSDQPTKSDGILGNESTNGSDGSALFSLYVLISILVYTKEELYTTIISYRIPIVGPSQIRWKILH